MDSHTRPLLILGTRTMAIEVADFVSEISGFQVAGFVENEDPQRCREKLENLTIFWVEELAGLATTHWGVCALATTHRSRFTSQAVAYGLRFATLVHPTARISRTSTLGEGTIISPGVIIASHTRLGRHVFVNRGALIGHHTEIGDHVTIHPGANIASKCRIGPATYVGMGAVVLDNITIGAHSVVGAGAVVIRDVPDCVQVVGLPAKIIKEKIRGK
jgi:sugar O-acyltransferase (sialic acid O-acetyltransferase NeuD family)